MNPYSPPPAATKDGRQSLRHPSRARGILIEVAQAFATIIGIMIGWAFIGMGQLSSSTPSVITGIAIIAASCLIGLKARRPRSYRRRTGSL